MHFARTVYLCIKYDPHNKHRLSDAVYIGKNFSYRKVLNAFNGDTNLKPFSPGQYLKFKPQCH
jgi:hypothetical protein